MSLPKAASPTKATGCTIPQYNLSTTGLAVLKARKHHEHALLAATGLSVGRVTAKQSAFLQAHMDVWATNQFFLHHHLIPDFYNLEMRELPVHDRRSRRMQMAPEEAAHQRMLHSPSIGARNEVIGQGEQAGRLLKEKEKTSSKQGHSSPALIDNSLIWQAFTNNDTKRHAYRNTVFLAKLEHARAVRKLLSKRAPCPQAIVSYWARPTMQDCSSKSSRPGTMESKSSRAAMVERMRKSPFSSNYVHEYCSSSVTRILNVMLRLGYKTASLIGVDLTSTEHFYTALPTYSEVARLLPAKWDTSVRAFVKSKHSNTSLHATGARGVSNFFDAFNLAHGQGGRTRLINLSPESLLATSRYVPTSPPPRESQTGLVGGAGGLEGWWRRTYLHPSTVFAASG